MQGDKTLRFKALLALSVLLLAACTGSTPPLKDFDILLDRSELSVTQGSSGSVELTLTPKGGFTGAVDLSLARRTGGPAPDGITLRPTSVSVIGENPVEETLTIHVDEDVEAGTYNLKLRAKGGGITKEAKLTLKVNPKPTFTLSLSRTSLTIAPGGKEQTTLTLTPEGGFTGTVNLSLVNQEGDPAPDGITLEPASVNVRGSDPVEETLTISVAGSVQAYTYNLKLRATSGRMTKEAELTITVQGESEQATTFTVNTPVDTVDANPGDGDCADEAGNCSLRAAVMEANALKVPVVINVPEDTYKLTRTDSDEQGGDLDIKGKVTLKGAGVSGTILDGNGTDRVLHIHEGAEVKVEGIAIQNGKASEYGGGILNRGTLTLTDSLVGGSEDANEAAYGGGIYNTGTLTLERAAVSGNGAEDSGGGIYNAASGTLTLGRSAISGNWAGGSGGGIYNKGTLTLEKSAVIGNGKDASGVVITQKGGGIYNEGTLTLTNSTVSGNQAGEGGGLYTSSDAELSFTTVAFNDASRQGGGIYAASGTVKLKGVILGKNTIGENANDDAADCKGDLTSLGYNLIGVASAECTITARQDDAVGTSDAPLDPRLEQLTGGLTKFHMPKLDSPALDKVPREECPSEDQRGVVRPQPPGGLCDIGAVERER